MNGGHVAVAPDLREARDVGPGVVIDAACRPLDGGTGIGVEVGGGDGADGGAIVVAHDATSAHRLERRGHLVRMRSVGDGVAEHPDLVDGWEVGGHCLERGQVGVNVRKDSDAHAKGEYTDGGPSERSSASYGVASRHRFARGFTDTSVAI